MLDSGPRLWLQALTGTNARNSASSHGSMLKLYSRTPWAKPFGSSTALFDGPACCSAAVQMEQIAGMRRPESRQPFGLRPGAERALPPAPQGAAIEAML